MITGVNIPKKFRDRREGDLPSFWASANKAEKKISFLAKNSIEQMCQDTWNWQKKNPNGYYLKNV
jgi:UDP-glucose 4-epimerase